MLAIHDLNEIAQLSQHTMSTLSGGKRRYASFGLSYWKSNKAITSPHQEMPEEEEQPKQSAFDGFYSLSLW